VHGETDESDRNDIEASLHGDGAAYARLLRRHEPGVTRQMAHYTRNPELLRELVQEVFVEAYRALPGCRPQAPFAPRLSRIASRVGYRHWKTLRRERERTVPLEEWRERTPAAPVEDREPSEAAELLYRLLERLPDKDRLVLTLMYFEECGTKEIAERMGWSRAKVKTQALRARRKMKEIAERERLLEKLGWTL